MVVSNTKAYTWDWYCHLVGDRASLLQKIYSENESKIKNNPMRSFLSQPKLQCKIISNFDTLCVKMQSNM
jgi:hypothetical protein